LRLMVKIIQLLIEFDFYSFRPVAIIKHSESN